MRLVGIYFFLYDYFLQLHSSGSNGVFHAFEPFSGRYTHVGNAVERHMTSTNNIGIFILSVYNSIHLMYTIAYTWRCTRLAPPGCNKPFVASYRYITGFQKSINLVKIWTGGQIKKASDTFFSHTIRDLNEFLTWGEGE